MQERAATEASSPYYTRARGVSRDGPELCRQGDRAFATQWDEAGEFRASGGAGFMRGSKVERIYREVKGNAIGGSEEIMKDLASRQLGW